MDEEVELWSWKGKDEIEIREHPDNYIVVEHRKKKEDGRVDETRHTIPRKNVETLWLLIKARCEHERVYGYKFLVRAVVEKYEIHIKEEVSLDVMMNAFNGGKFRAKYYFPLFYYPLKILEAKNKIVYFGRGGIQIR